MKTTLPIYRLKHQAKRMAREQNMPLHAALDQIAVDEGFNNWGHLSARSPGRGPDLSSVGRLYAQLMRGDLVISAARPGQGKTLLALALAVEAMKCGHEAYFFSLDYTGFVLTAPSRSAPVIYWKRSAMWPKARWWWLIICNCSTSAATTPT